MISAHYFNKKLSHGFVALFSGRMIQFAAQGLIGLFMPIFLYTHLNYSLKFVFLYYLIGHIIYGLFVPLGAQFLNKLGLRRALRMSVLFDASFFLCFFFFDYNPQLFLPLSLFIQFFSRMFFWLPYHVDMAKFVSNKERGREVSMIWATKSFLAVLMPILSGFLLDLFDDFSVVFAIAIIVYLLAGIPFLSLPRTKERYSWTYWQTVKQFFSKKNRRLVLSNMANGAENAVALVVWPIFIWEILKGNYLAVGGLSSLIIFITVILQLLVGKYADVLSKRKMLHWGSLFYSLGWIVKIFVASALHIFVIGAYHKFAQIFKNTPFDALNYEILADQGHYVDEYTVIKEIAVQLGKVLILLFAILVALNFGINWTFALAALASLFVNLL